MVQNQYKKQSGHSPAKKSKPPLLSKIINYLTEKKQRYKSLRFAEALGLHSEKYHRQAASISQEMQNALRHKARVKTGRILRNARLFPLSRIRETAHFLGIKPADWLYEVIKEHICSELDRRQEFLVQLHRKNPEAYRCKQAEYGWDDFDPLAPQEWQHWRESYLKDLGLILPQNQQNRISKYSDFSDLYPDEKKLLFKYRTLSPDSQKNALNLILQLEQRISDQDLQSSYENICTQIVSEINFASPDLGIHLGSYFSQAIRKMLEKNVHIKIITPPGYTKLDDLEKFHTTYQKYIENKKLQIKITSIASEFYNNWSNGFEIWILRKDFLSRLSLLKSDMDLEEWEAIGYWWHFYIERNPLNPKEWRKSSTGENIRMSLEEVNQRKKWFKECFNSATYFNFKQKQ